MVRANCGGRATNTAHYPVEAIEAFTGVEVDPRVLPEFPLKKSLMGADETDHRSVKVDYAVLARARSKLFLVELKTDSGSRREQQDTDLKRAVNVGFRAIAEGVIDIARATSSHQ